MGEEEAALITEDYDKRYRFCMVSLEMVTNNSLPDACADSVDEIWASYCHQGHCLNTEGVSLPDWQ